MNCEFTVNGKIIAAEVSSTLLLADFLRDSAKLTGTHIGCDTSQCGCCVVHVDGRSMKSCATFAWQVNGANIVTIEGLADGEELHPMQAAFRKCHALQCGYCTPGMIMTAVDMVNRLGQVSEPEVIREQLEGNICRCTGYHNIVRAIQVGAAAMHGVEITAPEHETGKGQPA